MTKFQKYASLFIAVCLMIIVTGLCCKVAKKNGYKAGYADAYASFKPDTVYRDSLIFQDRPAPVEVKPSGQEFYPIGTLAQLQNTLDSLSKVKPDTAFIQIPILMETKLYKDEKDSVWTAQITGWNATLDWIKVNQKTAYINTPIPTPVYPKFLLSPAITAAVMPGNALVGAGLEAQFWHNRWEFSIEGGYGLNFMPDGMKRGVYVIGKVEYNLFRK